MTIFFLIFFKLTIFFSDTGIDRFWKRELYLKHLQSKCAWLSACYLCQYPMKESFRVNIVNDSALFLHAFQIDISE
jgi:hypothetical protein